MLVRAGLIAAALISRAWGAPDDYPEGLFERSPVTDTLAPISRWGHGLSGQSKNLSGARTSGGCHHYSVWSYPWPQPC